MAFSGKYGIVPPGQIPRPRKSDIYQLSSCGAVDRSAALIAIYSTAVWEMKWALSNLAQPRNISRVPCKLLQLWHSLC
jgi:hypothetical protein